MTPTIIVEGPESARGFARRSFGDVASATASVSWRARRRRRVALMSTEHLL